MTRKNVSHCRRNGYFIYLLLLKFIILGFLLRISAAQTPIFTSASAYTCVGESTLYVHGGQSTQSSTVNQLFALDLTQPWTTSSPSWKNLTTSESPADYQHTMTTSSDQKSLIVWGYKTGLSTYSLLAQNWTIDTPSPDPSDHQHSLLSAVTDPTSGVVYIPSGASNGTAMMTYNPATNQGVSQLMPSQLAGSIVVNYGVALSRKYNSLFMYGGQSFNTRSVYFNSLFQYSLASGSWKVVNTTGTSPGNLIQFCMAPAYNGSKIVVFGGYTSAGSGSSDVFVLNVDSMNWTRGKSLDISLSRYQTACGVAGDNLVIWGGITTLPIANTTLIYNFNEDQWTTTFTPPTPSTTDPTQTSNKSSLGAPIGAGVASVALVAAISILIYFRKKSARLQHQNGMKEPSPAPWESKYIDMDSMSPPSDPPALENSKSSTPRNPNVTLGNPQNLEHSQGVLPPGTTALNNPQWTAPEQIHIYSSGPRSPQVLQPQESTSSALEDDILTEERLEQIIASQFQQQQQQQRQLHQQQMERIRLEQEALLAKLKHKLKS
ncbi:hypothetical protein BGZ49_008767 [Haplosporangium sp. Z 27]|nr:hypothetical protein BGZ49_008767 [Haplosporangium sp. Z 27]